jgi:hypothetical protein
LLGFLFSGALHSDNFIIADRILPNAWHNHKSAAVGAGIRNWAFPDSKVTSRIVVASIEDAPLLPGFALDKIATTLWT